MKLKVKVKIKRKIKSGSKIVFTWASDSMLNSFFCDGGILTLGKVYTITDNECVLVSKDNHGSRNNGWNGIKYDPYSGKCTNMYQDWDHCMTIKLVD